MKEIDIYVTYKAYVWLLPVDIHELRHLLELMLAEMSNQGEKIAGVQLFLVDDSEIASINKKYLHCSGPTNIISFPGGEEERGLLLLSLDTLARESFVYGQDEKNWLLSLLAHGLAHLAGYEHGEQMDALSLACVNAATML